MLIILTGKTASGKDTIKSALLSKYPNLQKVVTTTSRAPRFSEVKDLDLHFLSKEEFEEKIAKDEFVEYVTYGGNLYGTQKKDLAEVLTGDALWRIDPSRAGEIRNFIRRAFSPEEAEKLINETIVIYITVSDEVVLQRLKRRNISPSEIQKRMEDDAKIWEKYQNSYDFVFDNIPGKLNETIKKVCEIIETRKI